MEEAKLTHRRKKWPADYVWCKQDGNIYYSLKGYNEWLTKQAQDRYLQACGRDGAIEINFTHNKERFYITLPHSATAEGISTAAKIRGELKNKAKWGILTDADIAEAKGVKSDTNNVIVSNAVLFQEVAQKYLRQWDGDQNTKIGYVNSLNFHWMPHLALMPIHEITHDES